jgi:DNA repair protein RecN (Recombination protein N)
VAKELRELAMGAVDFGVKLSMRGDPDGPVETGGNRYLCTSEGIDAVRFYIAPNVGESTKPLKAIASGGELSRIMLALKSVLGSVDRVGTVVFDEIDAGIGGRIAEVVGRKLGEIGGERQVLCITHLPQIAARASDHFVVRKKESQGHTVVETEKLNGKKRISELARMLAGEDITPTALKHAESLLNPD